MSENPYADSAGVPWEGRAFEPNAFADDDGSADTRLVEAIAALRAGTARPEVVIDALRSARVLIPLLANLGEAGVGAHGQTVDKSADLSIVTVETPDGQNGLPVFSSVAAMKTWNPSARPVPTSAVKAALAAAAEGNTRMVLDPMAETEFVLRRPMIAALAQSLPWHAPWDDAKVVDAFAVALGGVQNLSSWEITPGDPICVLESSELLITLKLPEGLDAKAIDAMLQEIAKRLSESFEIAEYVDSLRVKLAAA